MPYFLRKRTKHDTAADTEAIIRTEKLLIRANRKMEKKQAERLYTYLHVDIVNTFEEKYEGGQVYYWL